MLKLPGLFLLGGIAFVQASSLPYVYLTISNGDTSEGSVKVLNYQTQKEIATVSVGINPVQIMTNPNDKYVYSLNWSATKQIETLSVVATATNHLVATIPLKYSSSAPWFAVSPDGDTVWVPNSDGSVTVVCAIMNQVLATIPAQTLKTSSAVAVAFSPDNKFAYVAGIDSQGGTLSVLSTTSRTLVNSGGNYVYGGYNYPPWYPVGPMAIVSPDGRFLYVAATDDGQAQDAVAVKISLPNLYFSGQEGQIIAFTPDGKYLYGAFTYGSGVLGGGGGVSIKRTSDQYGIAYQQFCCGTFQALAITPDSKYSWESENGSILIFAVPTGYEYNQEDPVSTLPLNATGIAFLH